VTLRARWVTLRARWVTLRARWVTLRARWVTLRARSKRYQGAEAASEAAVRVVVWSASGAAVLYRVVLRVHSAHAAPVLFCHQPLCSVRPPAHLEALAVGYGDAKLANRDVRLWHGATEEGP
jgi:hypothetical protein